VGREHRVADAVEVAGGERVAGATDALVFGHDVSNPAAMNRLQRVGVGVEEGEVHVAEGIEVAVGDLAEGIERGRALADAVVVARLGQFVGDAGVDDEDADAVAEGNRLGLAGPAVEKERRVGLAQRRGELVEDAALDADAWVGPSATVLSGTAVGENARVGANVVLDNVVVFPDATIEPGAVLRDCVVGENARVGPNTTVEGGAADVAVDGTLHEGVTLGGVIGDNARLGGSVSVHPGAVIGNGTTVEGGAAVEGRVPSGADVRRG